jgi:hypothetical protein
MSPTTAPTPVNAAAFAALMETMTIEGLVCRPYTADGFARRRAEGLAEEDEAVPEGGRDCGVVILYIPYDRDDLAAAAVGAAPCLRAHDAASPPAFLFVTPGQDLLLVGMDGSGASSVVDGTTGVSVPPTSDVHGRFRAADPAGIVSLFASWLDEIGHAFREWDGTPSNPDRVQEVLAAGPNADGDYRLEEDGDLFMLEELEGFLRRFRTCEDVLDANRSSFRVFFPTFTNEGLNRLHWG